MISQELENMLAKMIATQKKTSEGIDKMQKEIREIQKEMRKSSEEADKRIEKIGKYVNEVSKNVNNTNRKLDWMGVTQWDISEDLIESNFKPAMKKIWKDIKKVHRNMRRWKLEFDLLGVNSTEIFVWETKTRLTIKHIDKFLKKQLPKFKECFPKYNKYRMYWVVWWRVISKKSLDYALSNWLFVIKETHNWNAEIINKNNFKPKEFIS